ncbi:MAG: glycosyltransferase [Hyphomicrobiales bacterium]
MQADVLPQFPAAILPDALLRLTPAERLLALRHGIVAVATLPGMVFHATASEAARREAGRQGLRVVARLEASELARAIRHVFGASLLHDAVEGLNNRNPLASAKRRFSQAQAAATVPLLLAFALSFLVLPLWVMALAAGAISGIFFAMTLAIRVLALLPGGTGRRRVPRLPVAELPVYTVLVPLFRETAVLDQLIGGLMALDYPRGKLDIKLLLEESDTLMQRAVAARPLPEHFSVVIVPSGRPQTKPRALNYGLQMARGSLLTIYDSEDIPEPQQLRRAAEVFAADDGSLGCLQAALTFYNPNENWMTRQFTAEYAALFEMILPNLAGLGLPLPLGGTSNHFRTEVLRGVGAWDPFNVTEDADLGCRLARHGYLSDMLASRTYEEANTRWGNWMRQRRRWLKGFLQTWLVQMRSPGTLFRELGPAGFWTFQCMTLGVFSSALLHPFLLVAGVWYFWSGEAVREAMQWHLAAFSGLSGAVLLSGHITGMLCARAGLRRLGYRGWGITLATMPLYWMVMTPAAWLGLWDFIIRPHHWHKTEHGLSALLRRPGAGRHTKVNRA